jgi:hypothetical protein
MDIDHCANSRFERYPKTIEQGVFNRVMESTCQKINANRQKLNDMKDLHLQGKEIAPSWNG